jgi:Ca-activated chloride channel family protein
VSWIYPLTTMTFAYPWALLFPLCLLFIHIMRLKRAGGAALGSIESLRRIKPSLKQRLRKPLLLTLYSIMVLALSIAAARPQRINVKDQPRHARNIILALDVSRSMGTADFESSLGTLPRLVAVQRVVQEFVAARTDDRLGLVIFGSHAYLRAPLTLDHELIRQFVADLDLGMAGDGTAVGDGLGLSLKRLRDVPAQSRAVILLTDGVSNSGVMHPLKAAEVAAELGITVHTIGVGSVRTRSKIRQGLHDAQALAGAEYDEPTLKAIAEKTGGVFFNASSLEGLRQVYTQIDALERSEQEEPALTVAEEIFVPFAKIALISLLSITLLNATIFMRIR